MGRMWTTLTVQAGKRRLTIGALVDSGAGVTILSHAAARLLRLRTSRRDYLDIGASSRDVCYRNVDLHIPGTDCFVENMRVAVIADPEQDIPGAFLGADFLQRTGAFLDFRKGQHAIGGDVLGRDVTPPEIVEPRRVRLRAAGR